MGANTIWLWEEDYPSTLTQEEFENPLLVINDFFCKYSLQEGRLLLWEWLPYSFTQDTWYCQERRIKLFRFGRQLERLVDASWQFLNKKLNKENLKIQHNQAKILAGGNLFYLLSTSEIMMPHRVLKQFFEYDKLNRWKNLRLTDWYETLFDKNFCMNCNSNMLAEVSEYVYLNRLMSACYLIQERNNKTYIDSLSNSNPNNWCLIQENLTEIIEYGLQYYKTKGWSSCLNCLASIYYYKRWHHEWHASSGAKLIRNFHEVYKLLHIASKLIELISWEQEAGRGNKENQYQQIIQDKSIQDLLKGISMILNKWPIGILSRFLTSCIYTFKDPKSSKGQQSTQERVIHDLERLLKILELFFKRVDQLITK